MRKKMWRRLVLWGATAVVALYILIAMMLPAPHEVEAEPAWLTALRDSIAAHEADPTKVYISAQVATNSIARWFMAATAASVYASTDYADIVYTKDNRTIDFSCFRRNVVRVVDSEYCARPGDVLLPPFAPALPVTRCGPRAIPLLYNGALDTPAHAAMELLGAVRNDDAYDQARFCACDGSTRCVLLALAGGCVPLVGGSRLPFPRLPWERAVLRANWADADAAMERVDEEARMAMCRSGQHILRLLNPYSPLTHSLAMLDLRAAIDAADLRILRRKTRPRAHGE